MKKIRNILPVLLLAFLLLLLNFNAASALDEGDNNLAPNFNLKDLAGREVTLSALKGKVVLINFWATWCQPCRDELKSLEKLNNAYRGRSLVILAASLDVGPAATLRVKDFIEKNKISLIVIRDPDAKVSREYKVFVLPTSVLIDKKGRIKKRFIGDIDWADTEHRKIIDEALSE